jgi:HPr kinase/phosphorylase
MSEAVTVQTNLLSFAKDLGFEVVYEGRKTLTLASMSVERPGLQLAGFFDYFDTRRILVFGLAEYEYLQPSLRKNANKNS